MLWIRPPKFALRNAVSAFVLVCSAGVVLDFLAGLQWITIGPKLISTLLIAGIVSQSGLIERLRSRTRLRILRLSLQEMALIASSLMFACVFSEIALRLFFLERLTPKSLTEFQAFMASRWPRPIPIDKVPESTRIVGLADSMGVVGGASQNYYYLLEDHLRTSGYRAEMMNVSVSGNEPRHELAMLELAMQYHPDLVLHSFYVGNDFTLFGEDTYQVRGIRIDDREGSSRFRPQNFFLTDFLRNGLTSLRDTRRSEEELRAGVVEQAGHLSRAAYFALERSRLPLFNPSHKQAMTEVFSTLDAIRQTAVRGHSRYAMVINPEEIQVDEGLRTEVLQTFNVKEEEFVVDFPQQLMHSYCESRNILCLDLLPVFRATDNTGALYTTRDGHYSLKGNQTAAAAIYHFLIENKLVHRASPDAVVTTSDDDHAK
jgi:hypothetical protein